MVPTEHLHPLKSSENHWFLGKQKLIRFNSLLQAEFGDDPLLITECNGFILFVIPFCKYSYLFMYSFIYLFTIFSSINYREFFLKENEKGRITSQQTSQ